MCLGTTADSRHHEYPCTSAVHQGPRTRKWKERKGNQDARHQARTFVSELRALCRVQRQEEGSKGLTKFGSELLTSSIASSAGLLAGCSWSWCGLFLRETVSHLVFSLPTTFIGGFLLSKPNKTSLSPRSLLQVISSFLFFFTVATIMIQTSSFMR